MPNGECQIISPDRSHIFDAGVNFLTRASPAWKPLLDLSFLFVNLTLGTIRIDCIIFWSQCCVRFCVCVYACVCLFVAWNRNISLVQTSLTDLQHSNYTANVSVIDGLLVSYISLFEILKLCCQIVVSTFIVNNCNINKWFFKLFVCVCIFLVVARTVLHPDPGARSRSHGEVSVTGERTFHSTPVPTSEKLLELHPHNVDLLRASPSSVPVRHPPFKLRSSWVKGTTTHWCRWRQEVDVRHQCENWYRNAQCVDLRPLSVTNRSVA